MKIILTGATGYVGEGVMLELLRTPQEAFTTDGWMRTGDLGTIDKEGNIFLRGRCKTMILGSSAEY